MNQFSRKTRMVLYATVSLLLVFIFPCVALAQDPGGGPDAPVDGGLGILLAAGAAYGVKKYREGRRKNTEMV